jgi:hypothetical protein
VVSPLFRCLAKSIDKDGGRGIEIAGRLGYDDVNECFCRRDVVHLVRPGPIRPSYQGIRNL